MIYVYRGKDPSVVAKSVVAQAVGYDIIISLFFF